MKKLIFFEDGKVATVNTTVNVNLTVLDSDGSEIKQSEQVDVTKLKPAEVSKVRDQKVKHLTEIAKKKKKLAK